MRNPLENPVSAPVSSEATLAPLMKTLVALLRSHTKTHWTGPKVHVPEITAGAYFVYEQMRNAVEYREQHLFLRGAIERFLLRELRSEEIVGIGFDLVSELTKTRYLANDTTPEDQIEYLDYLVGRYGTLQRLAFEQPGVDQDAIALATIQILSVELARALVPNPTEAVMAEFTYASFLEHANISADDQPALYAAVHRALLKSDQATIRYGMFSREFPRWLEDDAQLAVAGAKFSDFIHDKNEQLQGARPQRMLRLVRRHIAPYLILREIIKTSPEGLEQLATTPSVLMEKARSVAENQYQIVTDRLKRSVIQAVIFLFITKIVLGVLIEVPYELFVYGEIGYLPLAINLLFPVLYMATVGMTIKIPGKRNTTQILVQLKRIVYQTDEQFSYNLKVRSRKSALSGTFSFFYALTSLATLALLALALKAVGFNIVSGVIFFVFLSTVSFFAYRISYSVREYAVIDEESGLFTSLSDFLLTPFIRLGQWLAEKYSKVNIFTTLLDIIIETPFKTLLRVIEQWTSFLREKRDDVLR